MNKLTVWILTKTPLSVNGLWLRFFWLSLSEPKINPLGFCGFSELTESPSLWFSFGFSLRGRPPFLPFSRFLSPTF